MKAKFQVSTLTRLLAVVAGGVMVLALIGSVGFAVVFGGRIYPGVVVHGVAVGGLSKSAAVSKVAAHDKTYKDQPLAVSIDQTIVRFSPSAAGITLDSTRAVDLAYDYGRSGSVLDRWRSAARGLLGRETAVGATTITSDKLAPYVQELAEDAARPVANAQFTVVEGDLKVQAGQQGRRLNIGGLLEALRWQIARAGTATIAAPLGVVYPTIATDELELMAPKARTYIAAPIQVVSPDKAKTVTLATSDIIAWLNASRLAPSEIALPTLASSLHMDNVPIQLGLDPARVDAYVAGLAGSINQPSKNAVLGAQDGKVIVTVASQNGLELDVAATSTAVKAVLDKPADQRTVTMVAKVTKPEVREDTLDQLGLKDQLSSGTTYFPGSPYTRLINVRTGAKKFNGVLLKPGEVFSFGKLLGEVDASTGYVPELVILNNHEEKQYGGGLCQVSSTAFRAALNAGLPILQRVNHSFAISYYTAPYGVPGVDATIYYPAVDFKFRNDTPGYLLMQTTMVGTTLTFDYYGTKTKTGEIRGPQFISGSTDATVPSHTIFWRDVKDLSGNVVRTDTFETYYQSSKDFPVTKQFN